MQAREQAFDEAEANRRAEAEQADVALAAAKQQAAYEDRNEADQEAAAEAESEEDHVESLTNRSGDEQPESELDEELKRQSRSHGLRDDG